MTELIDLYHQALLALGWGFNLLLVSLAGIVLLAIRTEYKAWRLRRKEEKLKDWDAALKVATNVYFQKVG